LVTIIPTSEATIITVNNIGEEEKQPEGIEFSDLNGRITLQDFAENDNDEDSNASDDDFAIDEEYKEEVEDEIALEEEEGIIGNDDPDSQEDYFQTPIQQHNTDLSDNNEPVSDIIHRSKRGINNPILTLSKRKKKDTDDEELAIENELDDNPDILNSFQAIAPLTGQKKGVLF
jgi:hypothetical protein